MKLEKEFDNIYHYNDETASTPKLSFYSLPSKPLTPPGSLTPPLHSTVVSIPFQWEEAPGKPRPMIIINPTTTTTLPAAPPYSNNNKSKAARCLDLPPRLTLTDHQQISSKIIASVPSPTTVFEGPDDDQGRSLSHTMSFSFRDQYQKVGSGRRSTGVMRPSTSRRKSFSFSSWRWGSFRDNRKASVGSFDFSPSTHGGCNRGGGGGRSLDDDLKKVKIAKVRRRSSFLSFSNNSNLVASMYGSFKQALPWRRRS